MTDFSKFIAADARLVILRELSRQTDYRLNDTLILRALEAAGHLRSRDFVRNELRFLESLGAVKIVEIEGVMIASVTARGLDHVERRGVLEGVARPGPED